MTDTPTRANTIPEYSIDSTTGQKSVVTESTLTGTTDSAGNPAGNIVIIVGENFAPTPITLTVALATAAEFDVSQYSVLTVQMKSATEALDQCEVAFRYSATSTHEVYYDADIDWTAPDGIVMIDTNGVGATTLASATFCSFRLDVAGVESVRIQAALGANTSVITLTGRGE